MVTRSRTKFTALLDRMDCLPQPPTGDTETRGDLVRRISGSAPNDAIHLGFDTEAAYQLNVSSAP
jgi:hypothetical protein